MKNIIILGDGSWGTTIAIHLVKQGFDVTLWGPFVDYLKEVEANKENKKFLAGITLPDNLKFSYNLKDDIDKSDVIVFAIPSKYSAGVLDELATFSIDWDKKLFLSLTKGIEIKELLRISEIVEKKIPSINFAVLSGPTIAVEVAKQIPSTAVIAAENLDIAKQLQKMMHSNTFRIYTNTDVIGVELGGSVKNVIALACGVCDGLGYGTNTKSAIVTRGLVEMSRLGMSLGAQQNTFSGLTGLGDLVTTCFSPKSRNRSVGELLGNGSKIDDILSKMDMVAEGVETAKAIYDLSKKRNISMPITKEVYEIIYQQKSPIEAVNDLMNRDSKSE